MTLQTLPLKRRERVNAQFEHVNPDTPGQKTNAPRNEQKKTFKNNALESPVSKKQKLSVLVSVLDDSYIHHHLREDFQTQKFLNDPTSSFWFEEEARERGGLKLRL